MNRTGYQTAISLLIVLQSTFAVLPVLADSKDAQAPSGNAVAGSSDSKDEPDPMAAEANTVSQIGATLSLKLKELENHFFGHLYITEPVSRRITRLERFVFGTESGGPYATRIEHVASSLSVSDPDGSKRTISIEPKAPPPPQAAADSAAPTGTAAPQAQASADNATQSDEQAPNASSPKAPADLQALAAAGNAKASAPAVPASVSGPGMEVSPVVNSRTRKTAEISTSVLPDRPGGGLTLQVNKAYFVVAGKPEQMIKELDLAIRVHPNDPELMFERGKAYIQLEKFNNALNDLSDAILGQPNKSAYYVARAWCYKRMGNSFLAADDIKQAHFVDPGLAPQVELVTDTK
jgi:hypothetical protein